MENSKPTDNPRRIHTCTVYSAHVNPESIAALKPGRAQHKTRVQFYPRYRYDGRIKIILSTAAITVPGMTTFAASSHAGLKRDHNEDYYRTEAELGLWLVADGVGGHADGEVAARIVGDTIVQKFSDGESLVDAILAAHQAVLKEIDSRENSNMGSTVIALKLQGNDYELSWVGDSRAYLYNGNIKQLSRDHNPVNELLARGAITPQQAAVHPERHVLSQSLGVSTSVKVRPGRICGTLLPGEQILLCSDGLTDELDDNTIAATLAAHTAPEAQVDALIHGALQAGGRDNVTVVLLGAAPGRAASRTRSSSANSTTRKMMAVNQDAVDDQHPNHDQKIWALLAVMGSLAILWVLLRVF